ncbi:MAG TPA: hypothetical protein VL737_04810 [Candidatus Pristimantibacillus sp.]|jgi:hypothetical protein|nr:hypothetical protein [Candidatus Pristimantibacillus sp.]
MEKVHDGPVVVVEEAALEAAAAAQPAESHVDRVARVMGTPTGAAAVTEMMMRVFN